MIRAAADRARSAATKLVAALALASSLPSAGCHGYVQTDLTGLERGDRVRLQLEEPASLRLGEVIVERVVELDGEVIEWDDERLALSAWWARSASGREHAGDGGTVYVPRTGVEALSVRRLQVLETGLLGAGGLAAGLALGALVRSGGGSGGGGPGGGPPQFDRVPGSP